jgi:hypothetical protein
MLSRSLLFDGVRPRAVLFLHRRCRNDSAAKFCELCKLMLNSLQPLAPLSVSDLNTSPVPAGKPKLLIQLLNVSDLHPENPDLVSKNP